MISWLVLSRYYTIPVKVYVSIYSSTNSSNISFFFLLFCQISVNQWTCWPLNSLSLWVLKFHIIMFLYVTFNFLYIYTKNHFYYKIWKDYIFDCIVLLIEKKKRKKEKRFSGLFSRKNVILSQFMWLLLSEAGFFFLKRELGACTFAQKACGTSLTDRYRGISRLNNSCVVR